jgi:hydrogenase-4 component F
MAILILLLVLPLATSGMAAIVVRPYRPWVGWLGVAGAAMSFATALWAGGAFVTDSITPGSPTDVLRIDPLSAVLVACITFVSLLASALGPGLSSDETADPRKTRRFRIYLDVFALTMLLAVLTQNVALMWVAIEATTIASAVAIPLTRTKASVEASWKYMLICSVGIALAFAGTVLAYFDFVSIAGALPGALNWSVLRANAPALHRELMQLAFVFILVGYGTKAGLAPMHTWMPDAYSEAPPSIAAMMSGVLVAVSMYAIIRWKAVVDATGTVAFTNTLLLGAGMLSVGIGAFSLVIQRHYKRMLAYSSVEHMGLVGVGLALGPAGMFAALLHLVNHAVAKSMVFLLAGRIGHRYGTTEIAGVSGLLRAMPWTGGLFVAVILALIGLPPFGLFVSEFLLIRAAFLSGQPAVAAVVIVLLLTVFVSLVRHANAMLYGDLPNGVTVGERPDWRVMGLAACGALLALFGLVLPSGVSDLLQMSVQELLR